MQIPHYVVLLIGLCYVNLCSSLSCYQCSSENDPECMEDFDTGNTQRYLESTDCDVNAARFCVKTTGIFGGVVGTRRMCSSRDLHNICQYITYPDHDRVYRACVYTCSADGCNAGTLPTISVVAMVIAFLCLSICLY